jgi:large subunit ribosomal protein L9
MEVILLEKIRNLGNLGDKVKVKPGFGRNFLIPQGKATAANPANLAKFEARRKELENLAQERLDAARARAEKLAGQVFTITARASDEGRLFGSVGSHDVVKAIQDAGLDVHRGEILLPRGTIRQIGEYPVDVELHSEVRISITLSVVAE